ncbi:MAG TPA: Na(+)/H(+) antiporter subunit B [Parvularculaceae bacterium]|nr:Na(+)/H(+) antiporter subunit B [Parvularculaceae bacterium]
MDHLVLRVITKMFFAPILLFALYVQFHGDFGPGGGFQAGVIFAVGFILHALSNGLEKTKRVLPPRILLIGMVVGLLFYTGTGAAMIALGGNLLDYEQIAPAGAHHAGQHWGIFLVEFGVGLCVASTMLTIFYHFAGREPEIDSGDW